LAAAVAYGAATAVQHNAAHHVGPDPSRGSSSKTRHGTSSDPSHGAATDAPSAPSAAGSEVGPPTGPSANPPTAPFAGPQVGARGLVSLLADPRWLLSVGGDAVGLALQVIALATGPVVVVQPLLVLAVAVALPVGWALGGPRPGRGEVTAGLAVIGALAVFFVLLGDPGSGRRLPPGAAAVTGLLALVVGGAVCAAVRGSPARVRAVVFGAVAGAGFGVVGVLLNATAQVFDHDGFSGLFARAGLVPLVALIVVGAAAMTLTQVSFQIGELSASFPANEAAAPVVAVILGGALLHEHVPLSPVLAAAYVACLVVVVVGTVRLAGIDGAHVR
jgi:drug/metabolite transporter (DMT)-like permease